MSEVVTCARVTKRYGTTTAVSEVSLSLTAGETVAFIGHNGAGKTTLMKLILGVVRPDGGSVQVLGSDPAGVRGAECRRRLGFLPENVAFHAAMTGREILNHFARLKGEPVAGNESLLHRVGLSKAASRRVGTYSKGMRQRLGLAQALIGKPRLLLLDEPTTGLDPESRVDFFAAIDDLRRKGTAILVSTHALSEIERHADRAAIIHGGRLLGVGPLKELRSTLGLPVVMRVRTVACATGRVADAMSGLAQVEDRAESEIVINCSPADRLRVLRAVAILGDVITDIEVESPGLDAIYRSMSGRERGS